MMLWSLVDDLKMYAESLYVDLEYEEKISKYTKHTPFTKESLLYCEIFEKFYPGHSDFIVGYWMHNKESDGCNLIILLPGFYQTMEIVENK